jgi:hypothetical protein
MGKQASNMKRLIERSLHAHLDGKQKLCASFARSTAHLIVKIRSESAHLIRKFTPLPVLCEQGKSRLISSIYPSNLSSDEYYLMGLKRDKIPSSQTTVIAVTRKIEPERSKQLDSTDIRKANLARGFQTLLSNVPRCC